MANSSDYQCLNCTLGFGNKNCSEIINYCNKWDNPCQNGGTCHPKLNGYTCQRSEKFTGDLCQTSISYACLYNNCKHNSTCAPTKNGYSCVCDSQHEGTYCEKKKDKCKGIVCQYGYCVNGACECDPKIFFCKQNSLCNNIKCLNGGYCADIISNGSAVESQCICPAGLTVEKEI